MLFFFLLLFFLDFGFNLVFSFLLSDFMLSWFWFNWLFVLNRLVLDFMLNFVLHFWYWFVFSFWLISLYLSSNFMLDSFMGNWLALLLVLCWFQFSSFVLNWLMLSSNLMLDCLVLGRLAFLFMLWSFMFKGFMLNSPCWNNLLFLMRFFLLGFLLFIRMLRMLSSLLFNFLYLSFCWLSSFFWVLLEFSWDKSNCWPFLGMLFLLSAHLDKKSASEYFFIRPIFNEIDGIDAGFKDNFEGSGIVFLDFDELEIGEGFFNILLNSIEIAFDQIKRDMLNVIC